MVKVRRTWLPLILLAACGGLVGLLGAARASGAFNPTLSLTLSNPALVANSDITSVTSLPAGNPALGNWALFMPAEWAVSRDTMIPYNDVVARGTMSADVDCDGTIEAFGPFNLTNQPADSALLDQWEGQITSWWSLLLSVDREIGYPASIDADMVSMSQYHTICAPQTFTLTIFGRSSPGMAPILTNPATAGVYTWGGSFVSRGAEFGSSVSVNVCVGSTCPAQTPTPSPAPTPTASPTSTAGPTATPVRTPSPLDLDGDGVPNSSDNCPSWSNPSQALPAWIVPAGDDDCDGYPSAAKVGTRASESTVGTVATRHCAATATANDEPLPDAWPVDFNDNQYVNGQEWLTFSPLFGSAAPGPPYSARFDLNADGMINGSDLLQLNPFFGKRCTS